MYNLQTETGWYIAGGIITHNCRCTPTLRLIDQELEQAIVGRQETYNEWAARRGVDDGGALGLRGKPAPKSPTNAARQAARGA